MAIVTVNKQPSPRELRAFGIGLVIFSFALAGLSYLRLHDLTRSELIFGIGCALSAVYFAASPLRRPIYLGWTYATFPIGWLISHLALALVFYFVVTPIALVMRLGGRDTLKLHFDRSTSSYWTPHNPSGKVERYFRQF